MVQNLVVGGKEYLPSVELAQRFGYTSDYVSRLAREKKVVATNINRKWFINEESLREFTRLASLGKEVRSDELKKERKAERLLHAHILKEKRKKEASHNHIALAQSLAVCMCGAFVGLLGWTVSGSDVGVRGLAHGLEESYTQIADAVVPGSHPFKLFSEWSVAAVSQTFVSEKTELFQTTTVEERVGDTSSEFKNSSVIEFSDEVTITFEDDGVGVIRPVFKNTADGQEFRMMLTPTDGQ